MIDQTVTIGLIHIEINSDGQCCLRRTPHTACVHWWWSAIVVTVTNGVLDRPLLLVCTDEDRNCWFGQDLTRSNADSIERASMDGLIVEVDLIGRVDRKQCWHDVEKVLWVEGPEQNIIVDLKDLNNLRRYWVLLSIHCSSSSSSSSSSCCC